MFDRCDADTMLVVDTAIRAARDLGHHYMGTEHLLLAFAAHRTLLPHRAAAMLPPPDAVHAAIVSLVGQPSHRDADVLRTVGIDLDQVRSAVRRTFGDEAMHRLGRRRIHQPWQPWRRPSRRCTSLLAGTLSVAPRVKQAFERARHRAERRQLHLIDPSSLLAGITEVEGALANRLLRDTGIRPEAVRDALAQDK